MAPSLHESFDRAPEVNRTTNRSIGLLFSFVLFLIGLWPMAYGEGLRVWALGFGVVFIISALMAPRLLGPLNWLWYRIGLLLHKVIGPIILGVMFFLVVTPIGLLMKLSGRPPLDLHFDFHAKSYWKPRDPRGPAPETMQDQF